MMKNRVLSKSVRLYCDAYSLVEIVISTGIVTAVALPLLALLASSHSMQSVARDQEIAARIARNAMDGISGEKAGTLEVAFDGKNPVFLANLGHARSDSYFVFDVEGRFLNQVEHWIWKSGYDTDDGALYLLRITLMASESSASLMDAELCVSQPAKAVEKVRSEERFSTRIHVR